MAEGIGITQLNYNFLSYETYSWCSVVEYKSCSSLKEVSRYYERIGVQLFLAYFLGTHDLHFENMIASGEYPVFIDLETFVNGFVFGERKTAEEEVNFRLMDSVLSTGLLPIFRWNQDGKGVDVSGLSGGKVNSYPFKTPMILHPKTSNMCIDYAYPKTDSKENLVTLQEEFAHPLKFERELIKGFSSAYQYVMDNREEFKNQVEELSNIKSRLLFADTQRYNMILSSSYHPVLLQNGAERELFLLSMWKGRKGDKNVVVKDEIQSLLKGDIPYFEYRLSSKDLYSGNGKIWADYFDKTPIAFLKSKIDELSQIDMTMQIRYIQTALELASGNRENYENKVYAVDDIKKYNIKAKSNRDIKMCLKHLLERLIEEAVWNEDRTEVSWCQIKFNSEKNMTWHMGSMNMYLYNGLAGMLLIFYELSKSKREQIIVEIYETLKRMLFKYTERGEESLKNIQSESTGMYDGESSLIYAYLILYQKSKESQYLHFAERHTKIVEKLIESDERYDLLYGNAGASQVY